MIHTWKEIDDLEENAMYWKCPDCHFVLRTDKDLSIVALQYFFCPKCGRQRVEGTRDEELDRGI